MSTVHWIGTGLSTGSGLRLLAERAPRVVLWGRTTDKARACLARVGLSAEAARAVEAAGAAEAVEVRAYGVPSVAEELRPGDVLVSMLPATEHAGLLRLCIERGAHFACSSYVAEPILAQVPAAREAGLVVLTEAGLDPGIDHLFADLLVSKAREAVGDAPATAEFTSYCGGIPAEPNEFRYRFSWAPRGVLTALLAPARYLEGGVERVADPPWAVTRPLVLDGEPFEVYPNRDSVPFIAQYGIPGSWRLDTFVRGTLRLDGWRQAWAGVFDELRTGDAERITALATELAARYPTTEADRDRVVLAVALRVHADGGATSWEGEYLLDTVGDETESAMARCVSVPLAFGVGEILDGALAPGLHQAADDAAHAQRWLDFLRDHGIPHRYVEHAPPAPTHG